MKHFNTLLLGISLFVSGMAFSQTVIFQEDFDASTNLPTGWTQYNVDGKTPNSQVSFMGTNAWVIRTLNDASHNNIAAAISYYNPVGQSDDWLVTPAITLTAGQAYALKYEIAGPDANYPDDYEVWVSTVGNTPTDLQAGTKVLSEVSNPGAWALKSINLSAFSGQTVYIGFRDVAYDKFMVYLDNIKIITLAPNDAELTSVNHNRLSLKNVNNPVTYTVTNQGSNAITSVKVEYSDGTTPVSEVINTNIPVGGSQTISFTTPLNYSTIVEKQLSHEIVQVNGATDPIATNNTAPNTKFNTISENYSRNVVFEEGTGTWCGWCVRGFVAMDYMSANYPDFIGIAVHNGDPMVVNEYDSNTGITGFPGCNVDRAILGGDVSQSVFINYYNQRKAVPTMGTVSGTVSKSGNQLTINATAKFNTILSTADLRLAAVIVENGVKGTASGYAQSNYYSGGNYGPMGGYENLPSTVPANQMVYDHVARAIIGGYNGQAGSIPTTLNESTVANYTFNYTVPSTSFAENMSVVILLIDNGTGEIFNATEFPVSGLATSNVAKAKNFNVYPNPATESLNVTIENVSEMSDVAVYDLAGKMVMHQSIEASQSSSPIKLDISNLNKGSYIVSISNNKESYTQHFVKE